MYQYASEPLLPWSDTDNDVRFNKVAKKVFIVFIVLFIVIPLLPTPEVKKDKFEEVPERFARLLIKQPIIKKPEPIKIEKKKPKKKAKKKLKKKPKKKVVKKKKAKPKPSAQKIAQSVFDSAGFDELADLREDFNVASLKNSNLKVAKKRSTKFDTSGILTGKAGSGSGGIGKNRVVLSGNTKLADHTTSDVRSTIPTTGSTAPRSRSRGWSDEEIQLVIQKNLNAIYRIYRRALRKDPSLQGTVVFKITLDASGSVIKVVVVSSELKNKSLERRLTIGIKRFKFGAKPGVSNFIFNKPISFIPVN